MYILSPLLLLTILTSGDALTVPIDTSYDMTNASNNSSPSLGWVPSCVDVIQFAAWQGSLNTTDCTNALSTFKRRIAAFADTERNFYSPEYVTDPPQPNWSLPSGVQIGMRTMYGKIQR